MKIILFSTILSFSFSNFAIAQFDFEENNTDNKQFTQSIFSYGIYADAKASLNAGAVIEGRKHFVALSGVPDFGLKCTYLLDEKHHLAINGEIGFNNYTYGIKIYSKGLDFEFTHSYLTFATTFSFTYFNMGFGFGIPLSSKYEYNLSTKDLNYLAEFKMGGEIPIYEDETGTLNINIKIGYMLTGAYLDYGKSDPLAANYPAIPPDVITNKYNPHPVSLALGLSWLFNY